MANRYWVIDSNGGSGTWDVSTTTNWSATDGGAGGASAPGSSDAVYFTSSSGTGTVNIPTSCKCASMDCTGFSGHFTSGLYNMLTVWYGASVVLGGDWSGFYGLLFFNGGTYTLKTNGISFPGTLYAVGNVSLLDNLSCGTVALAGGAGVTYTFTSNGHDIAAQSINLNDATGNPRSFNITNSNVTLSGTGTIWDTTTTTGLSITATNSTIQLTDNSSNDKLFMGGGFTYGNFYNNTLGSGKCTISGSNTFYQLNIRYAGTQTFAAGSTTTITNNFLNAGGSYLASDTPGSIFTITNSSGHNIGANFASISDSVGAGANGWYAPVAANTTPGTNSGWNFTSNRYWVGGSANWTNANPNNWSVCSGGQTGCSVPGGSNNVYFDSYGGSPTVTITTDVSTNNLTFTGFTGTLAGTGHALNVYGNLTLSAGMNWSCTNNLYLDWNTPVITSNTATIASTILISGGSVTLSDDLVSTSVIFLQSGTLNLNNKNVNAKGFSINGDLARTMTMGSGTVTLTATGTIWDAAITTNLTFNCNTSTIKLTNNSGTYKNFVGGGLTYYNFWNNTLGSGVVTIMDGGNVFNNFKVDSGRVQQFTNSTTTTVNSFTGSGATLNSDSAGIQYTLSNNSGGNILDSFAHVKDSIGIPANTWFSTTGPSSNDGDNTGWDFGDRYWVVDSNAGTGTWNNINTANWSSSSGGTGGTTVPQNFNYVHFDGNSGSGVVTVTGTSTFRTVDFIGFTGTITGPSSTTIKDTPNMTSNVLPLGYGIAFASSILDANHDAYKAFDGNIDPINSYGWSTPVATTTGQLGYEFLVPKQVFWYSVTDLFIPVVNAAPKNWTLEGSNDGTIWDTLDTQTNQTTWGQGVKNEYQVTTPGVYHYYRLNVSANNGATTLTVGELCMYESLVAKTKIDAIRAKITAERARRSMTAPTWDPITANTTKVKVGHMVGSGGLRTLTGDNTSGISGDATWTANQTISALANKIKEWDPDDVEKLVDGLSLYIGTPFENNASGCHASCTGFCSNTCNTACSNDCALGCAVGCTGSCTGTCGTSCTGGCSNSCTGACHGQCTSGCVETCSTGCDNACSDSCGNATCFTACRNACGSGCSGACGGDCSSGCVTACDGSCANYCGLSCMGGCGQCSAGCSSACKGTCHRDCNDACTGGCGGSCNSTGCWGGCKSNCVGNCSSGCIGGCLVVCSGLCYSGCVGYCSAACYGCSATCLGSCTGCTGSCNALCTGSCSLTCTGSCVNSNSIGGF